MPIRHTIWRVDQQPQALKEGLLPSEALLEVMIVASPAILSSEWMLIGRQEVTDNGGKLDLLALAPDGALILIELKRSKTPREVVAQALDYATWAETLESQDIAQIYARFSNGGSLGTAFKQRFQQELDEESLNQSHQIVIVAATLDTRSERVVGYLNQRGIAINVLCFQVFDSPEGQLLSRAWLLDPVETQLSGAKANKADTGKEPWNGEFYASFGDSHSRSWEDAREYGFISGGGGSWYSGTLHLLDAGDRVWVKVPGKGFVGVGRVRGKAVPAADFELHSSDGEARPALDVLTRANYHREYVDDPEKSEYFVPIEWLDTVPLSSAVDEVGLFGNQNTVCAPRTPKWRHTVERLKLAFPGA